MISGMEYDKRVRRYLVPTLALFGLFFSPAVGFSATFSQTSGSQSANSSGAGGHGGAATSVSTYSGHSATASHSGIPPTGSTFSGRSGISPTGSGGIPPTGNVGIPPTGSIRPNTGSNFSHNSGSAEHHRHHGADDNIYFPYLYAVPVPYAADLDNGAQQDSAQQQEEDDESDYQGGPTVFDRRGTGRDSYTPAPYPGPAHAQTPGATGAQTPGDPPTDAVVAADPPQPTTILVFKDGHQVEVANYAIVSKTLYDLSPDHPRKIALADLDLTATEKQNDDRGVTFQLPPFVQAN